MPCDRALEAAFGAHRGQNCDEFGQSRGAVAQEYSRPDFIPEEKATVLVDPAALSAYQGLCQITVGDVFQIKVQLTLIEGRLYLQADPFAAEPVELFPESETQFFAAEGFGITLNKNEDGTVTKITLHAGQDYEATKIP